MSNDAKQMEGRTLYAWGVDFDDAKGPYMSYFREEAERGASSVKNGRIYRLEVTDITPKEPEPEVLRAAKCLFHLQFGESMQWSGASRFPVQQDCIDKAEKILKAAYGERDA